MGWGNICRYKFTEVNYIAWAFMLGNIIFDLSGDKM